MFRQFILWIAFIGFCCAQISVSDFNKLLSDFKKLQGDVEKIKIDNLNNLKRLARQVSTQQLYVEEITRSGGDSGLKVVRTTRTGSKPYYGTTFTAGSVAHLHDHAELRGTVGLGEFIAVLNGVEFRTRHNDYGMNMKHTTSLDYGKTEPIPYPDVPPQVLAQKTIDGQILELREWFKAWKNNDVTKRDFRPYFKPNLCYLEGMWTNAEPNQLDEPFSSERHKIDAKSFYDLQQKIQYLSVTGRKSLSENLAFLPTTISSVDDNGVIKYSQWNYRILCHPLKTYVPLTRFRMVDDISNRVADGKAYADFEKTRQARFSLYVDHTDTMNPSKKDGYVNNHYGSFLDKLMMEIPGADNYKAYVLDDTFNETAYASFSNIYDNKTKPLNAGYFHRLYRVSGRDAMSSSIHYRGYADSYLYVAYNTRDKITPVEAIFCKGTACSTMRKRVSYAIPLEIVYTTPLQSWNPYNIKKLKDYEPETAGTNNTYKRTGGNSTKDAFAGYSDRKYYITPSEFFVNASNTVTAAADTAKNSVGMLDGAGKFRWVSASGIHAFTKNIPGLGAVRIRYPIMPIHQAGSVIYKSLDALQELALSPHKFKPLLPDSQLDNGAFEQVYRFEMRFSVKVGETGPHSHTVALSTDDIALLKNSNRTVTIVSSHDYGHSHELKIRRDSAGRFVVQTCDRRDRCWDGHSPVLDCADCRFSL